METSFVLSLAQRDSIMAAVAAIQRQMKASNVPLDAPALMVISTNLTVIRTALSGLPLAS